MSNNRKTSPDDPKHEGAREGNYKNMEESVNNPSWFNDGYASNEEDEIAGKKLRSKKEREEEQKGGGVHH